MTTPTIQVTHTSSQTEECNGRSVVGMENDKAIASGWAKGWGGEKAIGVMVE